MFKNKSYNLKILILITFFLYSTLILGFFFDEDSLGGAKQDYNFHLNVILSFKENIFSTLEIFGSDKMVNRNSPFFFILYGIVLRLFDNLYVIKILNTHIVLLLIFFFYKCLKIKFKYIKNEILYLISLTLFLSPTFRSLAIWPYPLIYALLFFLISIYFFLKFEKKNKFKYTLFQIIFLGLSSYITPNFSVFSIFFFFKFFEYYKFNKKIFIIIVVNLLIALPALIFLFNKGFYFFSVDTSNVKLNEKLNITNKIILIYCIFFFHILPIIFPLKKKISFKLKEKIVILVFYFICITFFDFSKNNNEGGGIIFKLSNFLFDNNLLLYFFFLFALINIYNLIRFSFFNFLLIILLIPYNIQFSIFHKYYDILVLFIFFLLLKNQLDKKYFNLKNVFYLYIFQIIFLILSLSRNFIYNYKL